MKIRVIVIREEAGGAKTTVDANVEVEVGGVIDVIKAIIQVAIEALSSKSP